MIIERQGFRGAIFPVQMEGIDLIWLDISNRFPRLKDALGARMREPSAVA